MATLTGSQITGSAPGDIRLTGNHTIVQWAHDVLTALGLPTSQINIAILVTWANIESGGYNPHASGGRNNPLNTTQPGHGGVGGGGQGNIMDYPSYEDGIAAIAENLRNPRFGYPKILAGLRAQDPVATFNAINASAFGTHINPGTSLSTSGVPGLNPFTDTPSGTAGQGATPAQETLDLQGLTSHIPVIGGLLTAATWPGKLAQLVIGVFNNWPYILEVLGGFTITVFGMLIIMHDVTGLKTSDVAGVAGKAAVA